VARNEADLRKLSEEFAVTKDRQQDLREWRLRFEAT
jgi:hypothetical protein